MLRLFSIAYLVFFAASSSFLYPVAVAIWLCTAWWDRRLRWLHLYSCWWGSLYLWANPFWSVRILGRQRIDPDKAYVIVSNHQSLLDILLAYRLFAHFKWVAKAELFRVPFVGWNMALNRYIGLKREDTASSIRQMLADCLAALDNGSSVFLFPEGTRSSDGRLGDFKAGAFMLAKKAKAPILPIAIDGTARAIPKGRLVIAGGRVLSLSVLQEIPSEEVGRLSLRDLMALCRERIEAALEPEPAERKTADGSQASRLN